MCNSTCHWCLVRGAVLYGTDAQAAASRFPADIKLNEQMKTEFILITLLVIYGLLTFHNAPLFIFFIRTSATDKCADFLWNLLSAICSFRSLKNLKYWQQYWTSFPERNGTAPVMYSWHYSACLISCLFFIKRRNPPGKRRWFFSQYLTHALVIPFISISIRSTHIIVGETQCTFLQLLNSS